MLALASPDIAEIRGFARAVALDCSVVYLQYLFPVNSTEDGVSKGFGCRSPVLSVVWLFVLRVCCGRLGTVGGKRNGTVLYCTILYGRGEAGEWSG